MPTLDESRLLEKLQKIEALFAGTSADGERLAAGEARDRIRRKLEEVLREDPPVEQKFSMPDAWSRMLFVALLRRYEIKPYRYRGQRYNTVMVRISRRFLDSTLWPEFEQLFSTLRGYLHEVTERVISQVVHKDSSDAAEVAAPPALGAPSE